jgi:energy-coupling factor transporter transmembrane protein EcfT
MRPTAEPRRPGTTLALGLALVLVAALAPAGLAGRAVPAISWVIWGGVFALAVVILRASGCLLREIPRRFVWLMPLVALLAVPAGVLAPAGRRGVVVLALGARAFAAAMAGIALATRLGPAGFVAGARRLGLPARLTDILATALASLTIVLRNARAMLRAREARRPGFGAWPALLTRPGETVRGFGRLIAALLLRSLERAEALEQARRARGSGDL